MAIGGPAVELLPWDDSGLALLEALNTPAGKLHLGGPESAAKRLDRHRRYLTYHRPGEVEMLRVAAAGQIVGSVGYWARPDRAEPDYEIGWELLPSMHGRGYGTAAARALLERLRPLARHRYVVACPSPANAGSNGICRKLGFAPLGLEDVEYPKGVVSPHNIWRLDLTIWLPPAA